MGAACSAPSNAVVKWDPEEARGPPHGKVRSLLVMAMMSGAKSTVTMVVAMFGCDMPLHFIIAKI